MCVTVCYADLTALARGIAAHDYELEPTRRNDIRRRLWERSVYVDRGYVSPCYEWTGPSSGEGRGGGYGRISLNDGTCAVHLVAWTNEHGYIPPRKQIDHKCNNRRCWRDDHHEMVSHKKNQKLRAARAKTSGA